MERADAAPFFSDGSPNTIFESFFNDEVAHLAAYCRSSRDYHLLHLPWYGLDWAELNNGAEVRAAPGYSQSAFINAHERLIDIALQYAGDDLAVEFPMSGYGPLEQVGAALTDHIVSVAGANSARIYVQSNGLGPNGDWGGPGPKPTEQSMDQAVWSRAVLRRQQMIQPGDYDWGQVFASPVGERCRTTSRCTSNRSEGTTPRSSRRRSPRSRNCSADPVRGDDGLAGREHRGSRRMPTCRTRQGNVSAVK